MVGDVLNMSGRPFRFSCDGVSLGETDTIIQSNVKDNDVIVIESAEDCRQVFLKGAGPTLVLTVTPSMLVRALKNQVRNRTGIPVFETLAGR